MNSNFPSSQFLRSPRVLSVLCAMLTIVILQLAACEAGAATPKVIHYCQAGRFKPCVCYRDVSPYVSYRPTYDGCAGNAAVLTRGKYKDIFSVVVRDKENRDRWPVSGFGGCSYQVANSVNPPARCSAFKVQRTFIQDTARGPERVSCLGARGDSILFKGVVRFTAKIVDAPSSTADPLARWCLRSPKLPVN